MSEYSQYITLRQFLDVIHYWTEWVQINVVNDIYSTDRKYPRYLSEDVFGDEQDSDNWHIRKIFPERDRLLKYYGDAHVWNVHAEIKSVYGHIKGKQCCDWAAPVIIANVAFSEVRDAWLREKADIQREKKRIRDKERREKKKKAVET